MKFIALAKTFARALFEGFHYGHVHLRVAVLGISPSPIGWVDRPSVRTLRVRST
jgi:hypothetical protein